MIRQNFLQLILLTATTTVITSSAMAVTPVDVSTMAAIKTVCHDYIDGQLEGNVVRVKKSLHPDVVLRGVQEKKQHKPFELEVETSEMLLEATQKGVLKQPVHAWNRTCKVLDVAGNAAAVRMEEGGFVMYFHMANFDGQWVIVDGFWVKN